MASTLAFSGSTNFLMNLPILLSILTYLAPSFSSSRFLSPLITKTLSSSTCTLISPDFSPGMSIMNTYELGYSFTSAGVAAMALASRNFKGFMSHEAIGELAMEERPGNISHSVSCQITDSSCVTSCQIVSQVGGCFGGGSAMDNGVTYA
ncbi:hypothetical protein RJ640_019532 [Escallonia rubra]|uniref:Uncharacterized protein n=1 Tax=Escallonia rubra TaxID=112253 RepID=A0AA88R840_9ASTE|nr:hypothetical protein RJ640_019532 [Escallonia rubra]